MEPTRAMPKQGTGMSDRAGSCRDNDTSACPRSKTDSTASHQAKLRKSTSKSALE